MIAGPPPSRLVDDRALVPLGTIVWRSCSVVPNLASRLVHDTPDGPLSIDLPAEMDDAGVKRRSEFLAGRLCAALALRSIGFTGDVGRNGRAPVWPAGVSGSISHTSDRAVAVVSTRVSALGVDCETMLQEDAAAEIAPVVLTAADRSLQRGHGDAAFTTLVFSAKEALYKALSSRLDDIPDFREAGLASIDAAQLTLTFRDWLVPVRFSLGPGECVTLAWLD